MAWGLAPSHIYSELRGKTMNRYRREGMRIRQIREAVEEGVLPEEFSARQVNDALGIRYASSFLSKHRVCNPWGNSILFMRVNRTPSLYRLIDYVEHIQ